MQIISSVAQLTFSRPKYASRITRFFPLCLEKQAGSLFLRKCRSCLFHQPAGGIRKTAVISTTVQNMYLQNQLIVIK